MRHPYTRSRIAMAGVLALAALALSGCNGSDEATTPAEKAAPSATGPVLTLTSPDVAADGKVPAWARGKYPNYCDDGENRSPNFTWNAPPAGTTSLVLMMTDLTVSGYTHWVVMDIPPTTTALPSARNGKVTPGVLGKSFNGAGTYVGPCVTANTYQYTLYALDQPLGGNEQTSIDEAKPLMEGHILAESSLKVHL